MFKKHSLVNTTFIQSSQWHVRGSKKEAYITQNFCDYDNVSTTIFIQFEIQYFHGQGETLILSQTMVPKSVSCVRRASVFATAITPVVPTSNRCTMPGRSSAGVGPAPQAVGNRWTSSDEKPK